ncbi:DUF2793 domain-containing protein [Microvirga sp. 2TAF3]|uniref:DUF2793 domain-containing protein n=1 Tax=Microvirga sp. 2TAF3 TaxID=3233014 RepID=UPI003F9A23B8
MSTTPHLALPLLAAAQAQKHVTHNEAIASLDALVHLSVKERGRMSPPASPTEGDRYLVGEGGSGSFVGHAGDIALFDLGVWRFFTPRAGWCAHIEAEDCIVVFDGAAWHDIGHYMRSLDRLDRFGIGTAADDLNRLAAKLNAALFTASTVEEGGTGDLRFVLNKSEADDVLSQLYQRGYSGRAETGLIGSDDFSIRVSPDGSQWRDAMVVDSKTGIASFPGGVANAPGMNLLMNSAFLVNQRAFEGGILLGGNYGFDRWRAGPDGCSVKRALDGTITLLGSLEQVVDVAQANALLGAASFAGCTLTLSVEDPSFPLAVTIGAKAATLPVGTGRRSVTVTLGPTETGHITVRMTNWNDCTFKRIKLELGPNGTPWVGETLAHEELRCRRYYQRLPASGGPPAIVPAFGQRRAGNIIDIPCMLPVPMRANPTLVTSGFTWVSGSPTNNQVGFLDNMSGAWIIQSGGITVTTATSGPSSVILRFQAASSFTSAAGAMGYLHLGASAFIGLQAEI